MNGRVAGLIGGAIGVVATGAAIGTAVVRSKRRDIADMYADEPLGLLPPSRTSTVAADDGVPLSVEEVDPDDGGTPEITVVLVHGFAVNRKSWHFQRRMFAEQTDPRVRQVLYDQRSHGKSARASEATSTIDQLGRDLAAVLRAMVPKGPIVLVGHSMGAMTVIALAEQEPDLFADRIRGVALIGTSAGEIGASGLPRPLLSRYNPLTRGVGTLADWQPGLVELVRAAGGQLTRRAVRLIAFGSRGVSPRLVDFMMEMLDVTPVRVLADFIDTLGSHNRYKALAGLQHCYVLVLSGDRDRMTPFSHAERIAEELPDAKLVRLRGAGHMVILEQPDQVNAHLIDLVRQCASGRGAGRRWWRRRA
ncbi:alpha/beta fold hydrolase [Kibdelosporangium persicum]|uniref:Pimeloyl-ACP methyl ester carboxylesterase n=1 Tax=Kibdelosporangium persicum TaxID=2698649 RepID=A0ABX2EZU1_9PSEU|nr:alpha/beta hydrolase [Kibdelosporangium persicum]NRN64549.1 Pimeloyl-ACP methyl ester carboxylesterase [Kibdelosporangium persicum]